MHWALQAACNGADARPLNGAGYAALRPDLACTFVDNPDTDTSPGQQVISNKLLAYAFLLTVEGYPFVYAKDYFSETVWPGAYGLQPWIDNLIWVHEHLANGPTSTSYADGKVMVLNRTGQPGLLTALNFDTGNAKSIRCWTSFGSNVQLHDYTGRHGDIWTDANGFAQFTIPSNASSKGQSYLCFSRAGLNFPTAIAGRSTIQTIFGSHDLDVAPATNSQALVGRISVDSGSPVSLQIRVDRIGWQAGSVVNFLVTDGHGHAVIERACTGDQVSARGIAALAGEHQILVTGRDLPETGSAFEIDITYKAPKTV